MNRRQFTQSLAALAATPALPAKALAGSATAAKAAIPLHQYQHPYSWAAFVARIHNKASPELFARQLSLSDAMARDVFDTLLRENVIDLPDAAGVSRAFKPFRSSPEQVVKFKSQNTDAPSKPDTPQKTAQSEPADPAKMVEETDADSRLVNQEVAGSEDDTDIQPHPKPATDTDADTDENPTHGDPAIDTGSDQLA